MRRNKTKQTNKAEFIKKYNSFSRANWNRICQSTIKSSWNTFGNRFFSRSFSFRCYAVTDAAAAAVAVSMLCMKVYVCCVLLCKKMSCAQVLKVCIYAQSMRITLCISAIEDLETDKRTFFFEFGSYTT